MRILADGGITKSGDIVKALTLSQAVICGGIFAGCTEAPGDVIEISGKLYKQYRGMGSLAAMKAGSAARYGQPANPTQKVAAEGIEALKEVCGSVDRVLAQLIGGIQIRHGLSRRGEPRAIAREGALHPRQPRRPARSRPARRRGIEDGELKCTFPARLFQSKSSRFITRGCSSSFLSLKLELVGEEMA